MVEPLLVHITTHLRVRHIMTMRMDRTTMQVGVIMQTMHPTAVGRHTHPVDIQVRIEN